MRNMSNVGREEAESLLGERRALLNRVKQIENMLIMLSKKIGYELHIDFDNDIVEALEY